MLHNLPSFSAKKVKVLFEMVFNKKKNAFQYSLKDMPFLLHKKLLPGLIWIMITLL